ncbi:MAG: triosephosphate isomerase (TIM) [Candidatus Tokpelaia sp. JSC161]|jgi:triosephosphate isomerase|nr:MAG: triosephosphate isomerase (TIM) [Candidatus Tokpelaia sp. JSC161]
MTPGIRPLIAGNWKMNGTSKSLSELINIADELEDHATEQDFNTLVCLPATLLSRAAHILKDKKLLIGGEDCHFFDNGPHTGDISASMLRDAGASYVIIGHSERRIDHHETDEIIRLKAEAAWRAGLQTIICIGETFQERESGQTLDILKHQYHSSMQNKKNSRDLIIAYEPIWAIGTGKTPTNHAIAEVHAFIRNNLYLCFGKDAHTIPLLYGGSVHAKNVASFLSIDHVDGVLVGSASLKASDFLTICKICSSLLDNSSL